MIYIIDLESVETRYTKEWKTYVPELLNGHGFSITVIEGPKDIPPATTPGAFLNFGGTNIYKSEQTKIISNLFTSGQVKPYDHFLFTDAWHPGIINLKYMSELLKIPVVTHGLWHAGSYDPYDFLGRMIGDAPWVRNAEKSFFHCFDYNYFATDFHIKLFSKNLFNDVEYNEVQNKIVQTGWPMSYMPDLLTPYKNLEKRNLILFPHRIAPEKQVEIFKDLAYYIPEYEFVVCQESELSKSEYYTLLGESKIVFSANLQETLGISCFEGMLVGSIPIVPDRLSYSEMYCSELKYESEFTLNYISYMKNKHHIIDKIKDVINNYDTYRNISDANVEYILKKFFTASNLLNKFN